MRTLPFLLLLAASTHVSAQQVTVGARGEGHAAALIDSVLAGPHVVRTGSSPLLLPRDSVVTSSLLVIGRPAYVASTVQGDVVVVGSDLFLRPGVHISGRAVAIGGTVAETTLGRVDGAVESFRDETFVAEPGSDGARLTLAARSLLAAAPARAPGAFQLGGLHGLGVPSYDRVNGLSVPLVAQAVAPGERAVAALSITYRSRLGAWDPALAVLVGADTGVRLELSAARETPSNDRWITSELINSLKTFAFGTDTRNYYRADRAQARLIAHRSRPGLVLEPWIGGRYERVWSASATGDVFSLFSRSDPEKVRRPNPAVEAGHVGSLLAGAALEYNGAVDESGPEPAAAPLTSRLELMAEQGITVPSGTSRFTQFTVDGRVEFPTFGMQRLRVHAHGVGSLGDAVPASRYAYLGGSRTLGISELLEFGGDQLLFVDSRYLIPLPGLLLPLVGPPTFGLIHRIGGAGVRTLGTLQQEVGLAVSLGPPNIASLDLELITGASGQHKTEFGIGVSLAAF
jgi:hypothetical protein